MIYLNLQRVCVLSAVSLLAACSKSNNLDDATAKSFISEWVVSQKEEAAISLSGFGHNPPGCIEGLISGGYVTSDLKLTGKVSGRNASLGMYGLPLYRGELISVATPRQVDGEKIAQVSFIWKYGPIGSDVPSTCEPNNGYKMTPRRAYPEFCVRGHNMHLEGASNDRFIQDCQGQAAQT